MSALKPIGPLTTPWAPPASCLSTTTQSVGTYATSYYLGWNPVGSFDPGCYPSLHATATVGSSPETTFVTVTSSSTSTYSAGDGPYPTAFYSPAVCPSGWEYAATYHTYSYPSYETESKYMCCPSGFSISSRTVQQWATSISYNYPDCVLSTKSLTNVWSLEPGWPTSTPASYVLQTSVPVTHSTYHASYFTVHASGLVVGWRSTDYEVIRYLSNNYITLPPSAAYTTRYTYPPTHHYGSATGTVKLPTGAIVAIVIAAIVGVSSMVGMCYRAHRSSPPAVAAYSADSAPRADPEANEQPATHAVEPEMAPPPPYCVSAPSEAATESHAARHGAESHTMRPTGI